MSNNYIKYMQKNTNNILSLRQVFITFLLIMMVIFAGLCLSSTRVYAKDIDTGGGEWDSSKVYTTYECTSGGLGIPRCEKKEDRNKPSSPSSRNNPVLAWLTFFVNLFSVIIVSGAAVMIAVAGIQYSASRDNAQATQAAKQKIFNVILGLLMYVFFYGFMQWLIPGGVF